MHPLPDQPLPDGWVYIEHPDAGRSENPVHRSSLNSWARSGWSEVADQPADGGAQTSPSRSTTAPTAEQASSAAKE